MSEPTLSEVHADLVARAKLDERLRAVETGQSSLEATVASLLKELPASEARLLRAIEANGPRSPWPAVGACTAVVAFLFAIAAAIYGA